MAYRDVRSRGAVIKDQVVRGEMPPWLTDGPVGEFVNDTRMTAREISTIAAWVDAGSPPGVVTELTEPPPFPIWQFGTPDVVLGMPKSFPVPANGDRMLREFSLPLPVDGQRYVESVEIRPGHPFQTHHATVMVKDGPNTNLIGAYLPGALATSLPRGLVVRVPKGASLTLSMHYSPDGEAVSDGETTIGVRFAKPASQLIALTGLSSSRAIDIAPDVDNYAVRGAPFVFSQDSHIVTLTPRMFHRGKDFTYTLWLPDGSARVLLKTKRWEDDWQPTYVLSTPVAAPKGSRLEALGRFDNTAGNENNPDPKQRVTFPQEVMEGYFQYTIDAQKPLAQ
jgi:hypothetical protein